MRAYSGGHLRKPAGREIGKHQSQRWQLFEDGRPLRQMLMTGDQHGRFTILQQRFQILRLQIGIQGNLHCARRQCAKMSSYEVEGIIEQDGHTLARKDVLTTEKAGQGAGCLAEFAIRSPLPLEPNGRPIRMVAGGAE